MCKAKEELPVKLNAFLPKGIVAVLDGNWRGQDLAVAMALIRRSLPLAPNTENRRTGLSKVRFGRRDALDCAECWWQSFHPFSCGVLLNEAGRIRYAEPGLESLRGRRTHCYAIPGYANSLLCFVYDSGPNELDNLHVTQDEVNEFIRVVRKLDALLGA